ncbi:MAG: hypothetical protein Q9216_005871 [Gyalolechia sp. 2 TL-2023]
MDRTTCIQLQADLEEHEIIAEGARQHILKLLRKFVPNTSNITDASSLPNPEGKVNQATPKRKAPASSVTKTTKKRTKKTAVDEPTGLSPKKDAKATSDDDSGSVKQEDKGEVKAREVKESESLVEEA